MRKRFDDEPMSTGNVVNLELVGDEFYPYILELPRYANAVRDAFENGDEIIEKSRYKELEKKYKLFITDYNATVIGSFEIWERSYPNGHGTAYITQINLPSGEHIYPILSKKGVKNGGVDPDLLVVKKY